MRFKSNDPNQIKQLIIRMALNRMRYKMKETLRTTERAPSEKILTLYLSSQIKHFTKYYDMIQSLSMAMKRIIFLWLS